MGEWSKCSKWSRRKDGPIRGGLKGHFVWWIKNEPINAFRTSYCISGVFFQGNGEKKIGKNVWKFKGDQSFLLEEIHLKKRRKNTHFPVFLSRRMGRKMWENVWRFKCEAKRLKSHFPLRIYNGRGDLMTTDGIKAIKEEENMAHGWGLKEVKKVIIF